MIFFLCKSRAHIRKIPNKVKLALQERMSQILFQFLDKLGLDDFEFDVTLLQTREAKVFASVVVLVPVAFCVVETCRFLWKIRYGNTLLSKCFNTIQWWIQDFPGGALIPEVGALTYITRFSDYGNLANESHCFLKYCGFGAKMGNLFNCVHTQLVGPI